LQELKDLVATQKLSPEMYHKLCMLHGLNEQSPSREKVAGGTMRRVDWVVDELAKQQTEQLTQASTLIKKTEEHLEEQAQEHAVLAPGLETAADIELAAQLPDHPHILKWLATGKGVQGLGRYIERC
jgi:hypothetical protein